MKKCNHIIGFCRFLDRFIFEFEKDRYKYLSIDCNCYLSDWIFNYCLQCGKKLDVKL